MMEVTELSLDCSECDFVSFEEISSSWNGREVFHSKKPSLKWPVDLALFQFNQEITSDRLMENTVDLTKAVKSKKKKRPGKNGPNKEGEGGYASKDVVVGGVFVIGGAVLFPFSPRLGKALIATGVGVLLHEGIGEGVDKYGKKTTEELDEEARRKEYEEARRREQEKQQNQKRV